VAERFILDDCILLAGDAAHVHSSGAAQGMNTGVHDAVNLAWKLGGVLRGWYTPSVLRAYQDERRAAALHLIDLDRTYSALISGHIPAHLPQHLTPNELLSKTFDEALPFNIGLGVHYTESTLIRAAESGTATAGWRAPDGLLYAPGPHVPQRLYTLAPNFGAFWVVVFAGEPAHTGATLRALRAHVDAPHGCFKRWADAGAVRFLTVIAGAKAQGDEALGMDSFGKFYYDPDLSVHARYGFSAEGGGIAVLRPDSILGYATDLSGFADVENYFSGFLSKGAANGVVNGNGTNGA
jgi:phenol 2-monooxygenase